ncbi:crotonase [Sinomonas cellulolyticus]|uniref:Enoyl-CoA hydratase/isomerase family protein n=1 Tax=Sinomonas cellulolyticus TaxID=2801916 RepID=A0ABS1K113_9MICC|nr:MULTISPECIES: enoyl-CoA hydratase/isomerase family protein [Sinomonas]MBL0703991.1 enoyl-CoA hydratase/isomerase family protein [Sinomonas cellulolyticus]GHG59068.1 crotonase [Sinomonas sp. KCTC 49339]
MVHENLVVERAGHVAVLRIDREDKLGALSTRLVNALGQQLAAIRQNPAIRAVVLTGTGRGFIAGADLDEYFGASPESFEEYQRNSRRVFDDLERMPQPVIAAVNGYAFGGGFEVALCCDFILAAEKAKFGLPEIKLGLLPGGGGTQRLSRKVSVPWAKDIIMTGRTVTAGEAQSVGLVRSIHSAEELVPAAMEFAQLLAAQAPRAVREAKRLLNEGSSSELSAALTLEQEALSRLYSTADGQEGIRAFREKRAPKFTGH